MNSTGADAAARAAWWFKRVLKTIAIVAISAVVAVTALGELVHAHVRDGIGARLPWLERDVGHFEPFEWALWILDWPTTDAERLERMDAMHSVRLPADAGPSRADDDDVLEDYQKYLDAWGARARFCVAATAALPTLRLEGCTRRGQFATGWRQFHQAVLAGSHFVQIDGGVLQLAQRPTRTIKVCNLAPLATSVARAEGVATPALAAFHREVLGLDVSPVRLVGWRALDPGECHATVVSGYDVEPEVIVHATPVDSSFEAWFAGVWRTHYARWLDDPGVRSQLAVRLRREISGSYCVPADGFERSTASDGAPCSDGEALRPFVAPLVLADRSLFMAVTYPGFSTPADVFDASGAVDAVRLQRVAEASKDLHVVARRYRERRARWAGIAPRFVLGADLTDANGPFEVGVYARGLPQETILFEPVQIPTEGWIHALNGQPVHSIEDVHEYLETQGGSRSAGIMAFTELDIPEGDTLVRYRTRYRFANVPQEFDTSVGVWEGLVEGVTFGSEAARCLVQRIFQSIDQRECVWLHQQRNAYARQYAPGAFRVGEYVSFIVPYGPIGVRFLKGGQAGSRLGRVLLAGAIEGAVTGAYEFATLPPAVAPEDRARATAVGASLGFVFGSAVYALFY